MMLKDRCVAESRGDRGQLLLLRTLFVDKAMQAEQEIREAILQYQDVLPSKLRALAQTTLVVWRLYGLCMTSLAPSENGAWKGHLDRYWERWRR